MLRKCRKSFENEASAEGCKTILRVAHMWQCDEIRELVFRKLDRLPISVVERVVLTTRSPQYDASAELREKGLAQLSARSDPLTVNEGRQLGIELTVQVAERRESIIKIDRMWRDLTTGHAPANYVGIPGYWGSPWMFRNGGR